MVNRGPSIGCQACRERRVGCDRAKPACKKCLARGQICPGYRDASGVVFKDESKAVFARHTKRAVVKSRAIPSQLPSDPHDVTIAFFFRQCVLPTRQEWPLGNEYFAHILPLYNSAAPSSALHVAVSAMALKVATIHHTQAYVQSFVAEAELAAVRALKAALSDPEQRLKDETLLAVLCLDFEQRYRSVADQHDRPHLKGALALIRQRGPTSFNSMVAQALYKATRGHVLLHALWSDDESEDKSIVLALPALDLAYSNAESAVQHVLQQVLCLERQVLTLSSHDSDSSSREHEATSHAASSPTVSSSEASSLAARAQALCDRLAEYEYEVSWGLSAPVVPLPHGSPERPSDASAVKQAFTYGQYICTYVLVLKLLYSTTSLAQHSNQQSRASYLLVILKRAQNLVSALCVSVIPILDRSRFLVRPDDAGMERTIDTETRPELSNSLKDDGLASASRSHMVCLTTWMLGILRDELRGAEDFTLGAGVMTYLQHANVLVHR